MEIDQICMQGLPRWKRKAIISIAAHHNHTCSLMHIDVPLVLVRIPVEDKRAPTLENWIIEKEYVRHAGRSKQLEA